MAYKANTINIPSGVSTLEPYSFPYGFAGGINIRVAPDQVSPNQSPDMLNMNYNNGGKLGNRMGFDEVNVTSWGTTPTRGMYVFKKTDGTEAILVAWGGKIYAYNPTSSETKIDLCTGTKTSLADTQTYFFTMGDKCYIYNGVDFCYYDGTNPVANVSTNAYAPTLTLGRAPTGGGTINEDLNYLSDSWKDSFSGTADATNYTLSFEADSVEHVWVDGVEITTGFSLNATNKDVVNFTTAPGAGTNNVVIQATQDTLMDATYITGCTKMAVYGGLNDNRIFAIRSNTRYHSGLNDPTYWPESNYVAITSDAEDIVGMGHMLDYLVHLKERSLSYCYPTTDNDGNVLWPVLPLNDEYGCIARDSIQPVNNGLIFLAGNSTGDPVGVVYLAASMVRGQLNVVPISKNINTSFYGAINPGLINEPVTDLQNAKSWIYDNKYWLRVGSKCWILDLAYSGFSEGVYCWYPYDGVPALAGCVFINDTDLYVGSKNEGKIYISVDSHSDVKTAFEAHWKSPVMFMDKYDWIKRWKSIYITFTASGVAEYTLTIITEDGEENIPIRQDAGVFSYGGFSYSTFTYGVYNRNFPVGQSEKLGNKGAYIQFKITNETTWEMTLLGVNIYYQLAKKVK